MPHMMF